jgi:hypothetical protein
MANLQFTLTAEGEIVLSANIPKTIMMLVAPANQRVQCDGFSVSFDGVSATAEPVHVELVRFTTGGTMTAATPVRKGAGTETIQTTGFKNATAEPTAGDVLRRYNIHPQTGAEYKYDPKEIEMPGGTRLGLRCTVPVGGSTINVTGFIDGQE